MQSGWKRVTSGVRAPMECIRCIKCREMLPDGASSCPKCHARSLTNQTMGEMLVDEGLLTPLSLEELMTVQRHTGRRLGALVLDAGLVDEVAFTEALAESLDLPLFDLEEYFIDPNVVQVVPEHLCERYRLIPLMKTGNKLVVAVTDPTNGGALQDLELVTGLEIKVVLALPGQILDALEAAFDDIARQRKLRENLLDSDDDPQPDLRPRPLRKGY